MIMANRPNWTEVPRPASPPRFLPGDLVRHRHYGYRGVVVAADRQCMSDDAWYKKNQTQPDRNQPWYHVLVHGSDSVTYAAQENLDIDSSREPIDHPLVDHFFCDFWDGRYARNGAVWPV